MRYIDRQDVLKTFQELFCLKVLMFERSELNSVGDDDFGPEDLWDDWDLECGR